MNRFPKSVQDAAQLLKLCDLLTSSVRTIVEEWGKESERDRSMSDNSQEKTANQLPSRALHQAQRTTLAVTGSLTELVSEAPSRVLEIACQYWESRALFIAAERHIPDLLADAGCQGLTAKQLGLMTGVEHLKLGLCELVTCSNTNCAARLGLTITVRRRS